MNTSIPWEWYRTFLAVLREGSLSGASRRLSITQPTAGRHIAALESALGQVLFTRSQTGLLATETALALRVHAEAMESTANTLTIELVLSNRVQDLLHREADIAVRMTTPVQEQLIARRVGRIELGLHASTSYLAQHGTPENSEDLLKHALIGFDQDTPFIRKALEKFPQLSRNAFSMRTDSDVAQLNLIRAGAGIGICQVRLANGYVPLQRLLPNFFSFYLDTWIVMHEDLRNSLCCKLVFDVLAKGLEEYIGQRQEQ